MKLDFKYVNARSNILMMQPLPKISLAYRLFIQDEKQQPQTSSTSGQLAYANAADSSKEGSGGRNYKPNARFVFQNLVKKIMVEGSKRPQCDHCKKVGHTINTC